MISSEEANQRTVDMIKQKEEEKRKMLESTFEKRYSEFLSWFEDMLETRIGYGEFHLQTHREEDDVLKKAKKTLEENGFCVRIITDDWSDRWWEGSYLDVSWKKSKNDKS